IRAIFERLFRRGFLTTLPADRASSEFSFHSARERPRRPGQLSVRRAIEVRARPRALPPARPRADFFSCVFQASPRPSFLHPISAASPWFMASEKKYLAEKNFAATRVAKGCRSRRTPARKICYPPPLVSGG